MPKSEVIVVASAAPSKRYIGIRIILKKMERGTKTKAMSIETFGLPLAVIIIVIIENIVKNPNPKTKILKEADAGKYAEE